MHDNQDFKETIAEVLYLLSDAYRRLEAFRKVIAKNKKHIHPTTYAQANKTAEQYQQEIKDCKNTLSSDAAISDAREYLRTHQGLFGALMTMTDWQSPSFTHSLTSQAGRETGKIYATINDYKRDQHWDSYRFEQAFLKHNIDAFFKFPLHVYATTSGMAAFTTILAFLLGEKKIQGNIVAGNSIYFENKTLITQFFPDQLTVVDESDTDGLLRTIDEKKPSVIFLDSLTNSPNIIVPDLTRVIRSLLAVKTETYLVIDNTGLSINFQPFPLFLGRRTNLRIIMFESLNKYHQFGADRTTGGIIVGFGVATGKLFDYRDHAGTNIRDVGAASLPTPNRTMLKKRLARHTKNASLVAQHLTQWIQDHPNSPFEGISFPGIGSYFTILFKKKYATIPSYRRFINRTLVTAKRHKVNLISGTSFGLDTTRIYLTAVRSRPNTPFVRVAVGTENMQTLESMCDVFIETLKRFR